MADFAVVVGIGRYPELSAEGAVSDLDGPDNDAQAVHDWLVDPEGGGLAEQNVKVVRSADIPPAGAGDDPEPAARTVERHLGWLERQTRTGPGDRLYLYFSGHGFSPELEEGALFTAEASTVSPAYVYAHGWLRWFRRAQRFRQFVLWMDACMNPQRVPVRDVPLRPKFGTGVPGPAFMAVAAQTRSALEHEMADGRVHGVFTWTLLHGLRGGAADERGRVTGESLRDYLVHVMPDFLPESARTSSFIDLQPFVRPDPGMVLRRFAAPPAYPVRITVPAAAVGGTLRVWTGRRPLDRVASATLQSPTWTGELGPGLYVADVREAGLRQGFQVGGTGEVDVPIRDRGPEVDPPDDTKRFHLDVTTGNPAASITVTGHRFERIFADTGELHEQDSPGVYKVRTEFGRDLTTASEEILLLDRDRLVDLRPRLASPAPIPGTIATHEYHIGPFSDAARPRGLRGPGGMALFTVLARYWTDPGGSASNEWLPPSPLSGLQLFDAAGGLVADLPADGRQLAGGDDALAVWEQELPPGAYFLRQVLHDGRAFEGCFVAADSWITQVALWYSTSAAVGESALLGGALGDAAVFLRPLTGIEASPEQDATVEAARLALAQGRNLFGEGQGERLRELLLREYADPVAGIVGCHLLLRALERQPDPARASELDAAVGRLRSMVGVGHPDVEALSLRCTDPALRTPEPFVVPPMFRHGWQLIVDASYERPELVPLELWHRVQAGMAFGPLLVWAADEATRAAHHEQLVAWMNGYPAGRRTRGRRSRAPQAPDAAPPEAPGPAPGRQTRRSRGPGVADAALPDAVGEAARRASVPAAGATTLWAQREG